MSYVAGANLLLARNGDLPFVLRLAADGRIVGDRFIRENESSYKLDGKVRASLDRNAAAFADIAGWALYLQGDIAGAEARLAEAARLYRNVDATNQLHLAELSRKKNDLETAREHYLTALGLAGITPPQRDQAKTALADVQAKSGENPAEFEKWLAATLDRKREERRKALVSNMAGRRLPALVLKDLQGNNVDLRAERGNVVLLNFFSRLVRGLPGGVTAHPEGLREVSWRPEGEVHPRQPGRRSGAARSLRGRAEVCDAGRALHARAGGEGVQRSRHADDVLRRRVGDDSYQVTGVEPHGDAVDRVTWYIEQLKLAKSAEELIWTHDSTRRNQDRPVRSYAGRSRAISNGFCPRSRRAR